MRSTKTSDRRRGGGNDGGAMMILTNADAWSQRCIWMGIFVLLAVVVSQGLNPVQNQNVINNSSDSLPVVGETGLTPRFLAIRKRFRGLSGDALWDATSGAFEAAEWLSDYDPAQLDVDDSALSERYIAALLFFSTHGIMTQSNWPRQFGFLNASSICKWNERQSESHSNGIWCNEQGFIRKIELVDNLLSGTIPSELGTLPYLESLVLGGNFRKLVGTIPKELGNIHRLERLSIDRTSLSGTIPTELSKLSNLVTLTLYSNSGLKGKIPSELGLLSNVELLWMFNNALTGPIPSQLGRLSKLGSLSLHSNQLSGTVPKELSSIETIESLHIYNNAIMADLNDDFCNREKTISMWADCGGSEPRVRCDCCDHCCPHKDAFTFFCHNDDDQHNNRRTLEGW